MNDKELKKKRDRIRDASETFSFSECYKEDGCGYEFGHADVDCVDCFLKYLASENVVISEDGELPDDIDGTIMAEVNAINILFEAGFKKCYPLREE